jgi:chromosomal replication initiation ATPase DnaA
MTPAIEELTARVARLEKVLLPGDELLGMVKLDGGSVDDVVRFVAFHTGTPARVILGPQKSVAAFRPRAAVCWACVRLLGKSTPVVGRQLGNRDHSSIVAAVKRAEEMMRRDPAFRLLCDRIESAIRKGALQ